MKILRIIPSMNPRNGGPCQGIRNSIPALEKLGISNEVVCFDDPSASFITKDNFKTHALGASRTAWAYNGHFDAWLEDHLVNYDIVIIHGLWLYHGFASTRYFRKRKKRNLPSVYIMPHGMLDPWFQRDTSRRLKAFRNEVYWRLIEKKVVNHADGLLFTCEQELLLARETFKGYKPKRELNIGYGIQAPPALDALMLADFKENFPAIKTRPYLLFLSRIHPKKGVDILIDAYSRLQGENISLPDLVIAGPLGDEYTHSMVEKAKSSPKIHFTGMLQGSEKWGAFYGCQAFILPSHQENFGIAVVEALACHKPVLISDQVNIWREIADGNAGIVAADTVAGVYDMLKTFIALSPEDQEEMGRNAQHIFEKHFTNEEAAKKMALALQR